MARPRLPTRVSPDRLPALEDQRRGTLAWVLPLVTTIASILLVRLYHTTPSAYISAGVLFFVTFATIIAHYHLRAEQPGLRALASMSLSLLTHACAFFLLTMIYSNKWRSMYSATAIALATMLMLLQLTDGEEIAWLRRLLYAVIGGLLIGEMTWVLNYWAAAGWTGGALLLVLFYVIAGLTVHTIRGTLGRRELVEYLLVGVAAFAIVTYSVTMYR
jgi:hypothetical protein